MMTTMNRGKTRKRRRTAARLLLAGSMLAFPMDGQTQDVVPPAGGSLPSAAGSRIVSSTAALARTTAGDETSSVVNASDRRAPPGAEVITSAIPGTSVETIQEQPYAEDLNQPFEQPLDPGAEPIDGQEQPRQLDDPTGIRLGSFLLRPSVSQSIDSETRRSGGSERRRDYLTTGIRGSLSSDWSRHSLTIIGEGTFERNFRGGQEDVEPEAEIGADLRLDLSDETVAHITGGYSFTREDDYDPNAIGGAATQSGVHEFTGGLSIQRAAGKIRSTAAVDLSRAIYTDAELADGTTVSMNDRDRTSVDGRLRLGYELSPALVPFVEVATGHSFYDRKRDNAGYARSSQSYAARTGVEFDLGEKLRGEIGTGYEIVNYEDRRLKSVDAVTFDGNAIWSPRRGTDVNLGLRTTVQDSTTPGQSGWVEYQATAEIAHELRDNVVARLTGGSTLRDFAGGTDNETVWVAGAGLTWGVNRYLDLTADVEYERANGGGSDERILRAGLGLTVKR